MAKDQSVNGMHIRKIEYAEIPLLADLRPPDWKIDLPGFFRLHYHEPYFHAMGVFVQGEMAGIGNIIFNGEVGWLGHIIVREAYRGQGLGAALTAALVEYCESRHCESIQLVATALGQPVYAKLGFQAVGNYLFMQGGSFQGDTANLPVFLLTRSDMAAILALDHVATGEDRSLLFRKFAKKGFVWRENGVIEGFFLPELGDGLIIATNPTVGIGLLQFKHAGQSESRAVLPESNAAGVEWLQSIGFTVALAAPRMFLKTDVQRRPEMIYSRISGYLG